MWQILSSDYDTQASYYGVKKASEPVHVQMNLPDLTAAVVNNTTVPLKNVISWARVFSADAKALFSHKQRMTVEPGQEADAFQLELPSESANDVAFVKLELQDNDGQLLSENFYWQASQEQTYKKLDNLPTVSITASAAEAQMGDSTRVAVRISNPSRTFAIMSKITLRNASAETRVLPAYLTDNYISYLPGEKRNVTIEAPTSAIKGHCRSASRVGMLKQFSKRTWRPKEAAGAQRSRSSISLAVALLAESIRSGISVGIAFPSISLALAGRHSR